MSKTFTRGTALFAYECIMQQLPDTANTKTWENRREKGRFFDALHRYMQDNGLGAVYKRIVDMESGFVFDHIPFKDEEHMERFFTSCRRYMNLRGADICNSITAQIYLLSVNGALRTALDKYISDPLYGLKDKMRECVSEEVYNIYQAARWIDGLYEGIAKEDMIEEEIIEGRTLSLIINAMYLKEYGLSGSEQRNRSQKPKYINRERYWYNGQMVKIKGK